MDNIDTNTGTNIDTDLDNYSVEDIHAILNLQDPSEYQVKDAANNIISQMRSQGNFSIATFFEGAKEKALESFQPSTMSDSDNEQANDNTQMGKLVAESVPRAKQQGAGKQGNGQDAKSPNIQRQFAFPDEQGEIGSQR